MGYLRDLGHRLFNAGERVDKDKLHDAQTSVIAFVMDVVFGRMAATRAVGGDLDLTNARLYVRGRDLQPTKGTGALEVDVAAGIGFEVDTSAGKRASVMQPYILNDAVTVTLGAHDATNPRIDVIVFTPSVADQESTTVRERPTGIGSEADATRNTHRAYVGTVSAVAGTPAGSPSPAAVPSGSYLLGYAQVPAVSGDVVVTDYRRAFPVGDDGARVVPDAAYHQRWVVSGCSFSKGGSGLTVVMTEGVIDYDGRRFYVPGRTFTLNAADATHDRLDTFYFNAGDASLPSSEVFVGAGTAATPAVADPAIAANANNLILGYVNVDAAGTGPSDLTLFSERPLQPYTHDLVKRPVVSLQITASSGSSDGSGQATVTVLRHHVPAGASVRALVEVFDPDGTYALDNSGGNNVSGTGVTVEQDFAYAAALITFPAGPGSTTLTWDRDGPSGGSSVDHLFKITPLHLPPLLETPETAYTPGNGDAIMVTVSAP